MIITIFAVIGIVATLLVGVVVLACAAESAYPIFPANPVIMYPPETKRYRFTETLHFPLTVSPAEVRISLCAAIRRGLDQLTAGTVEIFASPEIYAAVEDARTYGVSIYESWRLTPGSVEVVVIGESLADPSATATPPALSEGKPEVEVVE